MHHSPDIQREAGGQRNNRGPSPASTSAPPGLDHQRFTGGHGSTRETTPARIAPTAPMKTRALAPIRAPPDRVDTPRRPEFVSAPPQSSRYCVDQTGVPPPP